MIGFKLGATVVLSLAFGVGGTWSVGATSTGSAEPPAVLVNSQELLSHPFRESECTGYCVECPLEAGHAADVTPPSCPECVEQDAVEGGGWHTLCDGRPNCSNHECNPENFDFAALSNGEIVDAVGSALLTRDQMSLVGLLTQHPGRVEISFARSAVQVLACDGEVIAHYPIAIELLTMLNAL